MPIAYLVNRYPALSHSFVRREIQALERHAVSVVRISIRKISDHVDPGDQAESQKTVSVLAPPWSRFVLSCFRTFLRRPGAWLRAVGLTIRLWRSGGGAVRHLAYFAEANVVAELCVAREISHLHAHFGTNPAAVAMLASSLSGIGYSFTVHGPEEFDRPTALSLGLKIREARFVVAISSFGRSQLYRWSDATHWDKIKVVRCGIEEGYGDIDEASPVESSTKFRFLTIGRLVEQKGHMILLASAARLKQSGSEFELVIVGDGPFREQMEVFLRSEGLENHVLMRGALPSSDVRKELLESDAAVFPSFAEGLPVVIMEALALKRPVISTYVAGIPELVNDQCGWLVPAGNVEALVDAMTQAIQTSDERRRKMGEVGAQRVAAQHSVEKEAETLAACFRTVVGDAGLSD